MYSSRRTVRKGVTRFAERSPVTNDSDVRDCQKLGSVCFKRGLVPMGILILGHISNNRGAKRTRARFRTVLKGGCYIARGRVGRMLRCVT
eukprot:1765198-Pyramimonas_sp.AAC.1